jgi:hypothetical protein
MQLIKREKAAARPSAFIIWVPGGAHILNAP